MASLKSKVSKYLEDNSKTYDNERHNIFLQNDGSGDYIKTWNVSGLVKPNDSQLNSYNSAADTAETLNNLLYKRRDEYGSLQSQLDKLWHDIDDDKLDKNGAWYKAVKAVKDANPKE
jgi:hypothetical protein|tara:strand:- start:48 stop:398 length:351 start_codon:yes stop_codon:yes gene_type:complete